MYSFRATVNTNSFLFKEWIIEKNLPLSVNVITLGSGRKVWWRCIECGYEWQAKICHRAAGHGCPACKRQVATEWNNLSITHPEIAAQWHKIKNGLTTPKEILSGSSKKYWWHCKECGHDWLCSPNKRTTGSNCLACNHQVVSYINRLDLYYPHLSLEWYYELNKDLTPETVSYGSGKRVWWLCIKCKHPWKAAIYHRAKNGRNCPKCSKGNISHISQLWLNDKNVVEREVAIIINGIEYRVDGFDPKTKTIYEFLGDYWHGNPNKFKLTSINKTVNRTFGELYESTMNRLDLFEKHEYKVEFIWEDDYRLQKGIK